MLHHRITGIDFRGASPWTGKYRRLSNSAAAALYPSLELSMRSAQRSEKYRREKEEGGLREMRVYVPAHEMAYVREYMMAFANGGAAERIVAIRDLLSHVNLLMVPDEFEGTVTRLEWALYEVVREIRAHEKDRAHPEDLRANLHGMFARHHTGSSQADCWLQCASEMIPAGSASESRERTARTTQSP